VKILYHYVSNCRMSLIQTEYYRCSARQQIRKVIVLLAQSIELRSLAEGKENWSMEVDAERYCPYFSPYISYDIFLYELSITVRQYHLQWWSIIRTYYLEFENRKARLHFPKFLQNKTTFFINIFRKLCSLSGQQLSRSTILSTSFGPLLQDRNIIRFDYIL